MPKQEDDIFKFDPKSFWKELAECEHREYISIVDEELGRNVLVPVSLLETEDEEQLITNANKFYCQYKFIEKNLDSQKIEETVLWLRENSNLLNSIARQLAFRFIRDYEDLIKVHLKETKGKSDLKLPPFTSIFNENENTRFVRLDLDDQKTDQILNHLKQYLALKFESAQIWEKIAKEVLVYLAVPALEKIKDDLGTETVENLIAENSFDTFQPYFSSDKSSVLGDEFPEYEIYLVLQRICLWLVPNIAKSLGSPNFTLQDLDKILGFKQDNENKPIPITEAKLNNAILPFPTFAGIGSAALAQIRKDQWQKDSNGFAYFKHQAKGNPKNYIEHYISNPGDIELLPLEQAEQIIDKFGFNTVKLHLIFAAHTMNQERPWDGKFSLKASDIIKYLGWDKRTDLPVHQKLNEIAKTAFVLDCLLVKSVWIEGRNKRGGIDASTPTGRMWNVVVDPRGEKNSEGKVELMRAYLLGILTGRTDWQKYLELVGPGGTGKSTFTRLATALVGIENVHTTTLHKLEKSKFEVASIAGKRLVLINDSERYAGEVGKLKNLTGQDTLPYEVKFKQSRGGFNPDALVIVSTNEIIQSSDYTSGLARRRISVPMFNQIKGDRQKNLIEHKNGEMSGEFLPYIPGLLNWVLGMDKEAATSIVKNYEESVPSLLAMKARTLVETNPIADWLDNFVVYDSEARTNIGVAKRDKDSNSPHWYLDTDRWLYPNYAEYCHNSGTRPVSLRRFVTLLSDLGKNQLGLEINRERDRFGSYFVGLKIRSEEDHEPPLITGNTSVLINTSSRSPECIRSVAFWERIFFPKSRRALLERCSKESNTNVISRLWTLVMDKVTDLMDYVMNESIDTDECDECDGKIKKVFK